MKQLLRVHQPDVHDHDFHEGHEIPLYIIGTLFTVSLLAGLFFACRGRLYSKVEKKNNCVSVR